MRIIKKTKNKGGIKINNRKKIIKATKKMLLDILDRHKDQVIQSSTDWVYWRSIDLKGKRPREETLKLCTELFFSYRDVFSSKGYKRLNKLINYVVEYQGRMGFYVSTLEKGLLSFKRALEPILKKKCKDSTQLVEALSLLDSLYEYALFKMSDLYQEVVIKGLREQAKKLENTKVYLESVMGCIADPIFTFDKDGRVTYINPAYTKILGWTWKDIVGLTIEEYHEKVLPPELRGLLTERAKMRVKTGETVRGARVTALTKKGEKIPFIYSATGIRDTKGNVIGEVVVITDIRKLIEMERALTKAEKAKKEIAEKVAKESEKKVKERTKELEESRTALMNMLEDVEESRRALTNILEDVEEARGKAEEERDKTNTIIANFADGLLVFDPEGKLALINPQTEDFFDVKGRDLIGRPISELSTFPTLEPLVTLVGGEIKGVFRKELPVKENLTLEVSTIPMIREEERLGTLVILHNITREKVIERMKTEFVSLAAHQLRTPLSAIKWTLRMVLDGDLGPITEEQRNFMEKTYNSNERMITLINDLLDVTRIEEGRFLYKPILTDFEPICQFVINSYKEEIEKRELKLEFKKPEKKLPKVMLDVEKIRLAIQNLLDNAIRYTQPGGEVIVSLKYAKKEIEFSVKDTGVGIPKDQQERVFTKFFRGANVMRMATEGSGLGLFITKNIIEAHGGKIWFKSEENVGTTFYFTIPAKEEFREFLKEF